MDHRPISNGTIRADTDGIEIAPNDAVVEDTGAFEDIHVADHDGRRSNVGRGGGMNDSIQQRQDGALPVVYFVRDVHYILTCNLCGPRTSARILGWRGRVDDTKQLLLLLLLL